jgi:hypothetical protein
LEKQSNGKGDAASESGPGHPLQSSEDGRISARVPIALPHGPHDWIEDYADEDNGCYGHICSQCGEQFFGHKQRRFHNTCKVCSEHFQAIDKEAVKWLDDFEIRCAAVGLPIMDSIWRDGFRAGYLQRERVSDDSGRSAEAGSPTKEGTDSHEQRGDPSSDQTPQH